MNEGKGAQVLQRLLDVWEALKRADADNDGSVRLASFYCARNCTRMSQIWLLSQKMFRLIKTSGAPCGKLTPRAKMITRNGKTNIEIFTLALWTPQVVEKIEIRSSDAVLFNNIPFLLNFIR